MTRGRTHAVVLGGSMAGLAAARALHNHFQHVTLVERDRLGSDTTSRKGVPQGNHAHGLLASGYRILDAYFPGMMDELVSAGAMRGDVVGDFLWYQYGHWKLRADTGLGGIVVTRPLLESAVRARVRALPKLTLLEEHDVEEPVYDSQLGCVSAVRVRDRNTGVQRALDADLVIDATGRGSVAPRWLAGWGFAEVPEVSVKIDVAYSTGVFERRSSDFHGAMGAIIAGTAPQSKRFAAVLGAEQNRWVITLAGALGDHPSTELEGFREFARGLPTSDVTEVVRDREPLLPLVGYKFPANRQRHFEKLSQFPRGFLPLGDSVCSFNPLYGQGMSVALSEARALDECLASGDANLSRRYFARVMEIVASPWAIATGEDFRYPEVSGARPPGFGFISRYMERAHRAAAKDPVVLRRFFEVANLLAAPTAMLAPSIAWRVALGGVGDQPASPQYKLA